MSIVVKPSTLSTYLNAYENHIEPFFAQCSITEIQLHDLDSLIIELLNTKHLSPKSICIVLTVLKHIFKYAKTLGLNVADPNLIKRPKVLHHEIEILTDNEFRKLRDYCLSNPSSSTLGILITLYTGIRIGELCALQWKDIDSINGLIHINKTILRVTDTSPSPKTKSTVIISPPKSASSDRYIPIADCISNLIEDNRQDNSIYVLSGKTKYFEPRYFRMIYDKILDNAGISHYSYHALRHTFATKCVYLGFNPKTLSEILGHSDVAITFNTYIHPSIEAMKHDMGKFTLQ